MRRRRRFTTDTLGYGRAFRPLNVVDDCTHKCLAIEVDTSLLPYIRRGEPVKNRTCQLQRQVQRRVAQRARVRRAAQMTGAIHTWVC